jgi:hypothetical protein
MVVGRYVSAMLAEHWIYAWATLTVALLLIFLYTV